MRHEGLINDNTSETCDVNLESVIGEILVKKGFTLSTAESCTGGLLAGRLINYPGISSSYMEGVITYSNNSKEKRLGVKSETLKVFGAVSSQTAAEMAEGIAKQAGTDIGISVTGIAGPGGGTEEKPVGLVYLGMYIRGILKTKELRLSGNRQDIRNKTVLSALNWIITELSDTQ
jgi:PncC family amidohydrolase